MQSERASSQELQVAAVTWVPSHVEPQEHNLVINALHPGLSEVVLVNEREPFEFDSRLMRALPTTRRSSRSQAIHDLQPRGAGPG